VGGGGRVGAGSVSGVAGLMPAYEAHVIAGVYIVLLEFAPCKQYICDYRCLLTHNIGVYQTFLVPLWM